jgi:hypothetical protein
MANWVTVTFREGWRGATTLLHYNVNCNKTTTQIGAVELASRTSPNV